MNIPAHLRLDQREKKVPGKPTNRYSVPVIEFTSTRIADLIDAGAGPRMLGEVVPAQQLAPGALVPAKAPRASQPKVDRPQLGPPPAVPSGEGFGRRQPVVPTAAPPELTTAPEEPEAMSGWVVEDEPVAATEPQALTQDELFAELDRQGIAREYAAEVAKAKWPDTGKSNPLTPEMRAELLAELLAPDPEPVTAGL
jgi:hypothetical protein